MRRNLTTRHVLVSAVAGPALIALAVLAFAWPSARLQPRNLPVGIVGTGSPTVGRFLGAGDAFDVHHYADEGAARAAIEDRDVYGVFAPTPAGLTVLVASAAGPTVSQQLEALAGQLGAATGGGIRTVDVVPTSAEDPRGAVLSSVILPLVFGGEIIAVAVALLLGVRPARRQLLALMITSALTGLAVYTIAQGWLGALPHQPLATWAALALILLAISATTAGLFALVGLPGFGLAAITMIFLGNPFSGVTSAPELLPGPLGLVGQRLPPGAGGSLLRDTAYFDGAGALGPVCVLLTWVVLGACAVVIGHRRAAPGTHEQHDAGRHAVLEPAG